MEKIVDILREHSALSSRDIVGVMLKMKYFTRSVGIGIIGRLCAVLKNKGVVKYENTKDTGWVGVWSLTGKKLKW